MNMIVIVLVMIMIVIVISKKSSFLHISLINSCTLIPTPTRMNSESDDSVTFINTCSDWIRWTSEKSQKGIEAVHRITGLPWWTTIFGITIGVRLVVLPFRLRAWKNGRLIKLVTEHCNRTEAPQLRQWHQKNTAEEKRAEFYKNDMLKVHGETMKSIGVSPWKSLSPVPISVPLYLSVAAGLRAIDYGGEGAGLLWKNFGEADWMSAAPVTLCNFVLILNSATNQKKRWPVVLAHTINICSFVVLTQVPCSVNLFLVTSSLVGLIESGILKREGGGLLNRWVECEFKRKMNNK